MTREAVDWGLFNAKVGDLVRLQYVVQNMPALGATVYKLRRVTTAMKRRVVLDDGSVWRRNGNEWGSGDYGSRETAHLVLNEKLARKEMADAEAERQLQRDRNEVVRRLQVNDLTREQVDAILAVLPKGEAQRAE